MNEIYYKGPPKVDPTDAGDKRCGCGALHDSENLRKNGLYTHGLWHANCSNCDSTLVVRPKGEQMESV